MTEKTNNTETAPPSFSIRCPRLGHEIPFSYCRRENSGLPCSRAITCWQDHFDVSGYLNSELTPDEWKASFETPPKPKMLTLFELIQRAKS